MIHQIYVVGPNAGQPDNREPGSTTQHNVPVYKKGEKETFLLSQPQNDEAPPSKTNLKQENDTQKCCNLNCFKLRALFDFRKKIMLCPSRE